MKSFCIFNWLLINLNVDHYCPAAAGVPLRPVGLYFGRVCARAVKEVNHPLSI